jgi:putative ABC transport system permease protein
MLIKDSQHAWRTLRKNPRFAAVAVSCLAIGVGVNTMIFSVVDGLLLRPSPYTDSESIVVLYSNNPQIGVAREGISRQDYRDLRDQTTTIQSLAASGARSLTIAGDRSEPTRYVGTAVTWNLFGVLGTPPLLGRSFGPGDDRPGAEPVVLLGHDVWRDRYGGDKSIIGRVVIIDRQPHTVIGVMPPRFAFPGSSRLWVPLVPDSDETTRDQRNLQVFGRLKPEVTLAQASADAAAVAGRLALAHPSENRGWSLSAGTLHEWLQIPDEPRLMLWLMMGAVTLVLAIACSNVANLLLARASTRIREISIRTALGAGRWHIVRQLLTEAVAIGLLSVPLGVLIAWSGLALLRRSIPVDAVPMHWQWSLDVRSLAYMVVVAVAAGVVFGLAPAVHAVRANLQSNLRDSGHGSSGERRAWLRSGLVVAQVALAVILLVLSSLLVRSFLNLAGTKTGFDTAPLMTVRTSLIGPAYVTPDAKVSAVQDIVGRIEGLPGVQAVFASDFVPFGGGGSGGTAIVEGLSVEPGPQPGVNLIAATARLRQTLGVSLARGRDISPREGFAKSPVALINETMARKLWAGTDPLGRRFRVDSADLPDWFTVVGIVADFKHFQGDGSPQVDPAAYVPYAFGPALNPGLTIRVAGAPASIVPMLREQLRLLDPALPVFQIATMEERRQRSYWQYRLIGLIFLSFGAVALTLAAMGVYGVLSYAVSQRTHEIGVRVALGAARRDVMRLIVGHGLALAGVGIALGTIAAGFATPLLRTVLYGVAPTDPLSFVMVSVFLVCVAGAASYLPARRATAIDAITAIRAE